MTEAEATIIALTSATVLVGVAAFAWTIRARRLDRPLLVRQIARAEADAIRDGSALLMVESPPLDPHDESRVYQLVLVNKRRARIFV
jgi:hypothetical protein